MFKTPKAENIGTAFVNYPFSRPESEERAIKKVNICGQCPHAIYRSKSATGVYTYKCNKCCCTIFDRIRKQLGCPMKKF